MIKVKQLLGKWFEEFIKFPFYVLTHPIDGFYEMKRYKRGLIKVATFYIVLEATLGILQFRYNGFLFNPYNVNDFNYIRQVLLTLMPYILFIVANWSITTLMDGKGKFKDIYNVIGYALFLKVILSLFNIPLSNVLTTNEGFFYYGIEVIGYGVMLFLAFMGILTVHEYTVTKTFLTIGFTVVSAGVMLFVGLLSFSLIQQIYVFFVTIYREIVLRM